MKNMKKLRPACLASILFGLIAWQSAYAGEYNYVGAAGTPVSTSLDRESDGFIKITYDADPAAPGAQWSLAGPISSMNWDASAQGYIDLDFRSGTVSSTGSLVSMSHFGQTGSMTLNNAANLNYGAYNDGIMLRGYGNVTIVNSGSITGAAYSRTAISAESSNGTLKFTNTGNITGAANSSTGLNLGASKVADILISGGAISAGTAISVGSMGSGTLTIASGASVLGSSSLLSVSDGNLTVEIESGATVSGGINIYNGNTLVLNSGINWMGGTSLTMYNYGEPASTLSLIDWDGGVFYSGTYLSIEGAELDVKVADGAFEIADIGKRFQLLEDQSGNFGGYFKDLDDGDFYSSGIYDFIVSYETDGVWLELNGIAVPEPAEWAAIIGAFALAFAAYRRRK